MADEGLAEFLGSLHPIRRPRQYHASRALPIDLRVVHRGRGHTFSHLYGRTHQPPPGPYDHGVAAAQVFLGAVDDEPHAFSDGLILQMNAINAGWAILADVWEKKMPRGSV